MEPNCQLEEFFITRLHTDHRDVSGFDKGKPVQLSYGFDYDVGRHKEEEHRYRMAFRVSAEEKTEDEQPVGFKLESEIVGFFALNPKLAKNEHETLVRLNGVSILYGILRGIVATVTGTFPNGKLVLPAAVPADVVRFVESEKSKTAKKVIESQPSKSKPISRKKPSEVN